MTTNPQKRSEMLVYRIQLLFITLLGEIFKVLIDTHILRPNKIPQYEHSTGKPNVILSLTTYGRRVHNVHYTIISLLRQTYRPDAIILWLDEDNWNDSILPDKLRKLKSLGLTVKYCKDIKSYKKLIPALLEYPESIIVTCDDDIYYRKNMLARLMAAHEKWPNHVIAHRAHQITFNDNGELNEYNMWPQEISNKKGLNIFPTSGGGTLYKKEFFHPDVCKVELIMRLCPKADDIWNYFMGALNNTENVVLPYNGYIYLPLDVFYQTLHKGSSLSDINCSENFNDVQIKAIMSYYGLRVRNCKFERVENTPPHWRCKIIVLTRNAGGLLVERRAA